MSKAVGLLKFSSCYKLTSASVNGENLKSVWSPNKYLHQNFAHGRWGHTKTRAIIHSRQKEGEIKLLKVREADIFVAYFNLQSIIGKEMNIEL